MLEPIGRHATGVVPHWCGVRPTQRGEEWQPPTRCRRQGLAVRVGGPSSVFTPTSDHPLTYVEFNAEGTRSCLWGDFKPLDLVLGCATRHPAFATNPAGLGARTTDRREAAGGFLSAGRGLRRAKAKTGEKCGLGRGGARRLELGLAVLDDDPEPDLGIAVS
jgi:hypothetical protein